MNKPDKKIVRIIKRACDKLQDKLPELQKESKEIERRIQELNNEARKIQKQELFRPLNNKEKREIAKLLEKILALQKLQEDMKISLFRISAFLAKNQPPK